MYIVCPACGRNITGTGGCNCPGWRGEHVHEWKLIVKIAEGESVDSYEECRCQGIRHTYTYAPGNIQHVTIVAESGLNWTRGYAYGLLFGSDPRKRRIEPALT